MTDWYYEYLGLENGIASLIWTIFCAGMVKVLSSYTVIQMLLHPGHVETFCISYYLS